MKIRIGFLDLLTMLLVAAKIGGYIDWSWWVVLLPVLLPYGLLLTILVGGAFLICCIGAAVSIVELKEKILVRR